MNDQQASTADFETQFRPLLKDVFVSIAGEHIQQGEDAATLAREYAARGKPEFALAYLLAADLPDDERRDVLARAHEQRASNTLRRAAEFDRSFHRPFPLLQTEAAKDRAIARQIRDGSAPTPGAGRQLPLAQP